MKNTNFLISIVLLFIFSSALNAQGFVVDSLQKSLDSYLKAHPVNSLYVHMDRNEYAVGDTIWFKAYMLTPMSNEVLFVRITDNSKNIVLEKQFLVKDIRSNGDIGLPDDLKEGEYRFVAYMDRMINFDPENVFVQPFTVSKNIMKNLSIEAFVSEANKIKIGSDVEILLKVKDEDLGKAASGTFNLYAGESVYKSGVITTNNQGEAHIRFIYPSVADSQSVRCEVVMNYINESARLVLNLRHERNSTKLHFYPEGKHLIAGVTNNLVVVAKDDSNSPVSAKLILLDGNEVVGTTTTSESGIGEWSFVPRYAATYTIKIIENGTTNTQNLTCAVEKAGLSLQLLLKDDVATALISNAGSSNRVYLLLRSFEKIVWTDSLYVDSIQTRSLNLPIRNLPAGILSLIVCDSDGIPKVERVFMNKQLQEYGVVVNTKKKVEKDVTNVGVTIDLADKMGKPVWANLSVAVVEKSTINLKEYRTILHSHYFHTLLKPNDRNFDERSIDFDMLLKTSNWTNYEWNRIFKYRSTGPLRILSNTGGVGFIVAPIVLQDSVQKMVYKTRSWNLTNPLLENKRIIDTLRLTPSKHNRKIDLFPYIECADTAELVEVDQIIFTPKMLLAKSNEDKYIEFRQPIFSYNTIVPLDPNNGFEKMLVKTKALEYNRPFNTYSKFKALPVQAFNHGILLREVDVSGKGNKLIRLCDLIGDYYCINKVINCPNHKEIEGRPTIGKVYSCEISLDNNVLVDYNGPDKPFTNSPKGISVGAVHYLPLPVINQPVPYFEPSSSDTTYLRADIRSTVYWNPNLNTESKGKASFNFNLSSDRKSEFIIVVQGVDVETFKPIFSTYNLKL